MIQIAFGWRDSHLHQFVEDHPFEPRHAVGREPLRWTMPDADEYPGQPESEWTIAATFAKLSGPLYYEYDFGDGWVHAIELVEAQPDGTAAPRAELAGGQNRGPLEDSGGLGGYERVIAALADPTHPEHEELSDWVAFTLGPWERFDPAAFDVDEVNRELALRFDAAPDATAPDAAAPTLLQGIIDRLPAPLQREFAPPATGRGVRAGGGRRRHRHRDGPAVRVADSPGRHRGARPHQSRVVAAGRGQRRGARTRLAGPLDRKDEPRGPDPADPSICGRPPSGSACCARQRGGSC